MEKVLIVIAVMVAVFIGLALPGPKTSDKEAPTSQFATVSLD